MTADELRGALRAFMKIHGLKARPWSEAAGRSGSMLGQFLRGYAKTITFDAVEKLAQAAGADMLDVIGAGDAKPPASMAVVKWLKLEPQFGGQALIEDDRTRAGMLLPRALIERHAFGESERVRVAEIRESIDLVVRVGDVAAIDLRRNNPRRESGHYLVWDGHAASVRHMQPLTQDRVRIFGEGGQYDVATKELQVLGRVFWRCGDV